MNWPGGPPADAARTRHGRDEHDSLDEATVHVLHGRRTPDLYHYGVSSARRSGFAVRRVIARRMHSDDIVSVVVDYHKFRRMQSRLACCLVDGAAICPQSTQVAFRTLALRWSAYTMS